MKKKAPRSEWDEAVARAVRQIPKGMTGSYSLIALLAGKPGRARAVVRSLHALENVPWWRVIKSDGTVAKEIAAKQAPKLRREGVEVKGRRVPSAARWRPS